MMLSICSIQVLNNYVLGQILSSQGDSTISTEHNNMYYIRSLRSITLTNTVPVLH